jgi:hypothetical protein
MRQLGRRGLRPAALPWPARRPDGVGRQPRIRRDPPGCSRPEHSDRLPLLVLVPEAVQGSFTPLLPGEPESAGRVDWHRGPQTRRARELKSVRKKSMSAPPKYWRAQEHRDARSQGWPFHFGNRGLRLASAPADFANDGNCATGLPVETDVAFPNVEWTGWQGDRSNLSSLAAVFNADRVGSRPRLRSPDPWQGSPRTENLGRVAERLSR